MPFQPRSRTVRVRPFSIVPANSDTPPFPHCSGASALQTHITSTGDECKQLLLTRRKKLRQLGQRLFRRPRHDHVVTERPQFAVDIALFRADNPARPLQLDPHHPAGRQLKPECVKAGADSYYGPKNPKHQGRDKDCTG